MTASEPGSLSQFSVPSTPTAPSPFVIQSNTCGAITFPNTCTVTLDFAPKVAGPAAGNLTLAYTAGSETGTGSIPLTGTAVVSSAGPCHCVRLQAHLGDVREKDHGNLVVFTLHWKLECSRGSGTCRAVMNIDHGLTRGRGNGGYLTLLHEPLPPGGQLRVRCKGDCGETTSGEVELALHQLKDLRADDVFWLKETHECDGAETSNRFTLAFDAEGRFDPGKSHLK